MAINGHQVTGQIIPWYKFTGGRPPAPPKTVVAKPVKEEPEETAEEEASSLDDLFADDSEPVKAKPAVAKAEPQEEQVEPEESEDTSTPPEKFVHTAKTRQYLDTLNKQRTALDRTLRQQHFYFFSPRYSSVGGNFRILSSMAEKLPDALKDCTSPEDLFARLRRSGLGFISMEVCTDLYANKLTFPSLYELRNRVREEKKQRQALSVGTTY